MVKWRRSATPVELRSGAASCIFCGTETPHKVIRYKEEHRYSGDPEFKTVQTCQQCGGYRVLPDEPGS
jgi:hypothetical protein